MKDFIILMISSGVMVVILISVLLLLFLCRKMYREQQKDYVFVQNNYEIPSLDL